VAQPARLAGGLTLTAGVLLFGPVAAQEPAQKVTVQLRGGDRVSGALEDLEGGTLFVRVSLHDQRKIPMNDVALIDAVGGASGLPETELRRARGDTPIVVLSNGRSFDGTLTDIEGGAGSADPGKAREFVFRLADGGERRLRAPEVGRIYTGNYPGTPGATGTSGSDWGPSSATNGRVRVSAREPWADTGITVRQGQNVRFQTVGQVRLSTDSSDIATSAGRAERAATNAPMPSVPAGALIGRIGPTGEPFAIGNLSTVAMPGTGRLYLAVNDDELSDNAGGYEVTLSGAR
jgi:small nuclear ribonucleoprotein (snRNP)-like protein